MLFQTFCISEKLSVQLHFVLELPSKGPTLAMSLQNKRPLRSYFIGSNSNLNGSRCETATSLVDLFAVDTARATPLLSWSDHYLGNLSRVFG